MVYKKKKPLMRIGMAGRNVTYHRTYNVNWGASGNSYNRNLKTFKTRKPAIKFVKLLKKKHRPKYRVEYMYLAH